MTGYAEASAEVGGVRLSVELRSVNHRYADLRVHLPSALASHEAAIRRRVLDRVRRGRVELSVGVAPLDGGRERPQLNRPLLDEALRALTFLRDEWGLSGELRAGALLAIPGMFGAPAVEPVWDESKRAALDEVLDTALAALEGERGREGQHLRQDLLDRLQVMLQLVEAMRALAADLPARLRERLLERLRALAPEVQLDPARMAHEAAILADRADVTEELVRLSGHLDQTRALLGDPDGEPVGKRIEFLLQEIGRETNTINSKASDLALSREALALKAEVEKVREQAQNLE